MTKQALARLWQLILGRLSEKANADEVLFVDTLNAPTSNATPLNADTLGGVAASNYALKTDIGGLARNISIPTSSWSADKLATISIAGITASSTVFVSPAPSSSTVYNQCGIRCSAQAAGSLTFAATTAPTSAVSVNVIIL